MDDKALVAGTTRSPSLRPTSSTATRVWLRVCASPPMTISLMPVLLPSECP